MNSISELRLLTPRPPALAGPDYRATKAAAVAARPQSVATAPVQDERPAARPHAPEPTRAQSAEQRLKKNRPEEGPLPVGAGAPEVELKFGDFLDLINPLQHIPIVGTIYRTITGDEIGGPAKILGGMLFGGPIGFISAIFDTIVTQATGRDLGETVLAAFVDRDAPPEVQVAGARGIRSISAPDDASEDGPPTTNRNPGPALGHGDPFGLQRSLAAAVAVTPAAPTPVATAEPPARPLAAATPSPQAVTASGTGLDRIAGGDSDQLGFVPGGKPRVPAAQRPGALPVPVAAGAPVVAVELDSADASKPGNRRLGPNVATTDRGFAERMLEALDKYQVQTS